jgi:hypothetical protein
MNAENPRGTLSIEGEGEGEGEGDGDGEGEGDGDGEGEGEGEGEGDGEGEGTRRAQHLIEQTMTASVTHGSSQLVEQQNGSVAHTAPAQIEHVFVSAVPIKHSECLQVLGGTSQVLPHCFSTSVTHSASHSDMQQNASAAQTLVAQAPQLAASGAPVAHAS